MPPLRSPPRAILWWAARPPAPAASRHFPSPLNQKRPCPSKTSLVILLAVTISRFPSRSRSPRAMRAEANFRTFSPADEALHPPRPWPQGEGLDIDGKWRRGSEETGAARREQPHRQEPERSSPQADHGLPSSLHRRQKYDGAGRSPAPVSAVAPWRVTALQRVYRSSAADSCRYIRSRSNRVVARFPRASARAPRG